jgi:hypothetical protein
MKAKPKWHTYSGGKTLTSYWPVFVGRRNDGKRNLDLNVDIKKKYELVVWQNRLKIEKK